MTTDDPREALAAMVREGKAAGMYADDRALLLREVWPADPAPRMSYAEFERRFWKRTCPGANGCIIWTGAGDRYGRVWVMGCMLGAHRAAYWMSLGNLTHGLQVDHICGVTLCVNPEHLRELTPRANTLRNGGPTALNATKTHCIHGHEFTPENTRNGPKGRDCRACERARFHRRKARAALAAAPSEPMYEISPGAFMTVEMAAPSETETGHPRIELTQRPGWHATHPHAGDGECVTGYAERTYDTRPTPTDEDEGADCG